MEAAPNQNDRQGKKTSSGDSIREKCKVKIGSLLTRIRNPSLNSSRGCRSAMPLLPFEALVPSDSTWCLVEALEALDSQSIKKINVMNEKRSGFKLKI